MPQYGGGALRWRSLAQMVPFSAEGVLAAMVSSVSRTCYFLSCSPPVVTRADQPHRCVEHSSLCVEGVESVGRDGDHGAIRRQTFLADSYSRDPNVQPCGAPRDQHLHNFAHCDHNQLDFFTNLQRPDFFLPDLMQGREGQ